MDPLPIVMYVFAILVTLANLVCLTCWAFSESGRSTLRSGAVWVSKVVRDCFQSVHSLWQESDTSSVDILRQRREHELFLARVGLTLALFILQVRVAILFALGWNGEYDPVEEIVICLTAALTLAGFRIIRVTQPKITNMWYCLLTAMAVLYSSVTVAQGGGLSLPEHMSGFRLFTIALSQRTGLVVMGNLVHLAVVTVLVARYDLMPENSIEEIVYFEFLTVCFYSCLHLCLKKWLDIQGRLQSQVLSAMNESSGAMAASESLLSAMSDAVFELDPDMKLREHSARLAGVLLCSSDRSLAGVKFEKFLATKVDQAQFRKHMSSETAHDTVTMRSGSSVASVFHLNLRDSVSSIVKVMCFHIRIFSADGGGTRNLIGIRELSNNRLDESEGDVSDVPPLPSSACGDTPVSDLEQSDENLALVTFNATSWRLFHVSDEFKSAVNHTCCENSNLRGILLNPMNDNFFSRYKRKVDSFIAGKGQSDRLVFCNVVVESGRSSRLVTATVSMDLSMPNWSEDSDEEEEEQDASAPIVRAIFTNIRPVPSSRLLGPRNEASGQPSVNHRALTRVGVGDTDVVGGSGDGDSDSVSGGLFGGDSGCFHKKTPAVYEF